MRSFYRYLLISLVMIAGSAAILRLGYSEVTLHVMMAAAMGAAVRIGYLLSESDHWNKESESIRMMSQRIRELEEREKSRTSSATNTEQPPKNE